MAARNTAVLETPRLRLRPMDARDEAMFCHLYTDPEVMRRILPPLSMGAATQSFARACQHNAKDVPGHRFWAIDYTAGEGAPSNDTPASSMPAKGALQHSAGWVESKAIFRSAAGLPIAPSDDAPVYAAAPTTIGMAALLRTGDSAELGVMLRNGWWNRGISSEAFVPLIDHAFLGMGLALVYAQRPDDDHARIIDKLLGHFGFVRTPETAPEPHLARWELPRTAWEARKSTCAEP